MDGEGAGPNVVGDAAQAAAGLLGRIIGHAADLAGRLDQRPQNIDMEIGVNALHHGGRPLQAHARVDVFAGQRMQIVGRRAPAVELREHQVPNLDRSEGRVAVDFAARAADAVGTLAGGVGRPEVLVLAQPLEPIWRQLDLVQPDVGRFVVVEIDRGRKPLGVEPQPFSAGEKLPCPVDGLALEIVAKAEVAQHLEERMVIGRAADVVDVAGPQAFLAGRGARELQLAAAEEVVLELVHARGREQHRGVPTRHQHVAGPADAAFGFEKGQVFFPEFVGFHWEGARG